MVKIKNKLRSLALKSLVGLMGFLPIAQSANALDLTLDNNVKSKYVGWGMAFGENPVFQNALTFGEGKFSFTFFVNRDLKTKKYNELDGIISFTQPISDKVEATASYLDFNITGQDDLWDRIPAVSGSLDFNVPFSPSLSAIRVFDYGTYFNLSGSKDIPVNIPVIGNTNLSLDAGLGYNVHAFREKTGFSHVEGKASLPIDLGENVSITPTINYSHPLASDFDNQFHIGLETSIGL